MVFCNLAKEREVPVIVGGKELFKIKFKFAPASRRLVTATALETARVDSAVILIRHLKDFITGWSLVEKPFSAEAVEEICDTQIIAQMYRAMEDAQEKAEN